MTLKYESEILYGLMKREGDVSPSDVLPYESELKEKYLNQVIGAYPKLQDYRAEWLNYNLYKGNGHGGLVNISTLKGEITLKPGSAVFSNSLLKNTTTYTISFNCSSVPSTGSIEIRQVNGSTAVKMENITVAQGYNQFILVSASLGAERIRFKNDSASTTDFIFNDLMILEGNHIGVDIPYIEPTMNEQSSSNTFPPLLDMEE